MQQHNEEHHDHTFAAGVTDLITQALYPELKRYVRFNMTEFGYKKDNYTDKKTKKMEFLRMKILETFQKSLL